MPDSRCQGLNAEDTAACEECHARGFTWVIRPDGSMICSEAARFVPDDDSRYTGPEPVSKDGPLAAVILGLGSMATLIAGGR